MLLSACGWFKTLYKNMIYLFFKKGYGYKKIPPPALDFAGRIKVVNGIIIVTPEYNRGYPASLKSAIDLLYEEWDPKPVAISTVSDGNSGNSQMIILILFILWKMITRTVGAMFPVPMVDEAFDENWTLTTKVLPIKKLPFSSEKCSLSLKAINDKTIII